MSLIPTAWCFNVKCIVGGIFWGKSFSIHGVINKNIPRSLNRHRVYWFIRTGAVNMPVLNTGNYLKTMVWYSA